MDPTLFARSSDGGGPIGLLFLLFFFGALIYGALRRRRVFRAAGEKLGLQRLRVDSETLSGELRGMDLRVHFIPGGKNAPPHMAIEVGFSPCALLLELRRQTSEEVRAVEEGKAVDLQTGDADFDRAWIVEGAPPARVLRLLRKKKLRARLLAYAAFPEARVTVEDGRVSLYRRGTDEEGGTVNDERIQLALSLAEAVAVESEKPPPEDEPAEIDEAASTYRSTVRRPAGDSATDKIKELKTKRGERRLRALRPAILMVHAIVPGLAVLVAAQSLTGANRNGSPLAIVGVTAHLAATAFTFNYLRRLRKASPGLSFDVLTRRVLAGSWGVLAAVMVVLRLR